MIINNTFVPASSRHAGYTPPSPRLQSRHRRNRKPESPLDGPKPGAAGQSSQAESGATTLLMTGASAEADAAERLAAMLNEPRVRKFVWSQASPASAALWLQTARRGPLPGERGPEDGGAALPSMADVRKTTMQLRYSSRTQYMKIAKWLDDEWVRLHLLPVTDQHKLVLPNQMILWSERRRRWWKPYGPMSHSALDGVPNPVLDAERPRLPHRQLEGSVWAWLQEHRHAASPSADPAT
jgi:hypothetical protein